MRMTRYVSIKADKDVISYEKLNNIAIISLSFPPGLELAERVLRDLDTEADGLRQRIAEEEHHFGPKGEKCS